MSEPADPDDAAWTPAECTGISRQLAEPLLGTAPHAYAWLLLAHPGPWPSSAPAGLLDPLIADELERRRKEHRVRVAAVRQRPSTSGATQAMQAMRALPYGCYLASTRPGRTWLERVPLAELKDLLELDFAALAEGVAPGIGEPVAGPLYAVCTHGKRDVCCAVNGRPVHDVLARLAPGRVWESTHLGGHRFAANMLVLPEGVLYGRVDTASAADIVERHARGEIVLGLLRGRTATPQHAQAAEWFARRATGRTGIDDIVVEGVERIADTWQVDLLCGDQLVHAVVEQVATGTRLTGCAGDAADPGRWRLLSLHTA